MEELKRESLVKDNKIKELQQLVEIYRKKDEEEKAKKMEDEEMEKKEAEMKEQIRQQEIEKEKLAREREEMERVQKLELDRKKLEEKYKEKLEEARIRKRRTYENEDKENDCMMEMNDRIPNINRALKPRIPEKVRYFNPIRANVVRLKITFFFGEDDFKLNFFERFFKGPWINWLKEFRQYLLHEFHIAVHKQ